MSYTIAGVKVLNEHLALGVFGLYGALGYVASSGGDKKASSSSAASKPQPPIGAASSDEESFIKQFLAEAEGKGERLV